MDSGLLCSTAMVKVSESQAAGLCGTNVPKLERRLHSLGLLDNIRGGIRSVSYASTKGISPISMTSQRLEGSQGTRGKGCELFPVWWIAFWRVADDEGGIAGGESVPYIRNLGSFPEWVRVSIFVLKWNFCFLSFFFSFLPFELSYVTHPTSQVMARKTGLIFETSDQRNALNFTPGLFIAQRYEMCFFPTSCNFENWRTCFPFSFPCTPEASCVTGKQRGLFQRSLSKMWRVKGEFITLVPSWGRDHKDPSWPAIPLVLGNKLCYGGPPDTCFCQ